jgi:hypothetical protein
MGAANRRGTYEERKAKAIARDEEKYPKRLCDNCKHKPGAEDGNHCYMFRVKPVEGSYCAQHRFVGEKPIKYFGRTK